MLIHAALFALLLKGMKPSGFETAPMEAPAVCSQYGPSTARRSPRRFLLRCWQRRELNDGVGFRPAVVERFCHRSTRRGPFRAISGALLTTCGRVRAYCGPFTLRPVEAQRLGGGMYGEQRLAIENLRFLAKTGGDAEFYDELRTRLVALAESWEQMQLADDEREQLTAHRRRLIFELDILRARIPRE